MDDYIDPHDQSDTALLDFIDEFDIHIVFHDDCIPPQYTVVSYIFGSELKARGSSVRQALRNFLEARNELLLPQPADTLEEFYHND